MQSARAEAGVLALSSVCGCILSPARPPRPPTWRKVSHTSGSRMKLFSPGSHHSAQGGQSPIRQGAGSGLTELG